MEETEMEESTKIKINKLYKKIKKNKEKKKLQKIARRNNR